jgi:hypothetical protein
VNCLNALPDPYCLVGNPRISHISKLGASGPSFGILVVILRQTTKTQVDPDFAAKLNAKRTAILRITLLM